MLPAAIRSDVLDRRRAHVKTNRFVDMRAWNATPWQSRRRGDDFKCRFWFLARGRGATYAKVRSCLHRAAFDGRFLDSPPASQVLSSLPFVFGGPARLEMRANADQLGSGTIAFVSDKPYYSVRSGKHPTGGKLNLHDVKSLTLATYRELESQGCFWEHFGRGSSFHGDREIGLAGRDIKAFFFKRLKTPNLWPLEERCLLYDQNNLFDVIELLHDCASLEVAAGRQATRYDRSEGQAAVREAFNEFLAHYGEGYELNQSGEVITLGPKGLRELENAPLPPGDPENVQARVEGAINKFRRRGSSAADRRDAVRDLVGVLEFLRPQAKAVLTERDESDLFNIANNFGIRHHNTSQKNHYDESIWLSWMFYYYLAAIHAASRLIERANSGSTQA